MSELVFESKEELVRWMQSRQPLFIDSIEFEGMSLSFVNPFFLED